MNVPPNEQSIEVLLGDISRSLRKLADRRLAALGLTHAQCHAIISLQKLGPLTQAYLAETMEVENATIARSIARLELAGWVRRHWDHRDRRTKVVSVTDKAASVMSEIAAIAEQLAEDMLRDISDADRGDLLPSLDVIKSTLNCLLNV